MSNNFVRALEPGDEAFVTTLDLIKSSFAFMTGLIDPPSSVERLTLKKLKRMAEVEEMVGPMLFLISSDASYINGQTMIIDGGMSAW